MALLDLDLTGSYAIDIGYEWRATLFHPGNVVGSSFKGEIRNEVDGELITSFRFDNQTYDPAIDRTRIPIVLSPQQTRNLEPTRGGYYVYDLRMSPTRGSNRLVLAGKVHVNQAVTR